MSSTGPSDPLNAYAADWGGILTSTFLASVIYGISVLQSFYYYNSYPQDRITWKVLVAVIFVLDTAALGLFMYCMQYYLVLSWGMPEMLLPDVKPFPTEYVLTAVLVLIVQAFYINTIRALKAPLVITLVLVALSLTAFGSSLILPVVQLRLKLIPVIVEDWLNHVAFNIARGAALACDLGIVAALCWLLGRRKTDVRRANNMINALIAFSVERGVLQAIVQAGEVLAYAIRPTGIFFLPFHVIVSRIYCTSLLATLNTREYVARRGMPTHMRREEGRPAGENALASSEDISRIIFTSYFDPPFLAPSATDQTERSNDQERAHIGADGPGTERKERVERGSVLTRTIPDLSFVSSSGRAESGGSLYSGSDGKEPERHEMKDLSLSGQNMV